MDRVVIAGAARTPIGSLGGELASVSASELGSIAILGAQRDAGADREGIDEVIMGCVLAAGQGQAPARQASIKAGIASSAGATTVNKMCGSGLKATMLAHDAVLAGSADIVVAGGMESMSNAPYLLPKARAGFRIGHGHVLDHMFLDGLEDAYERGQLMGAFAERFAQDNQITRTAQDAYAIASLTRAQRAIRDGIFDGEIAPVVLNSKNGQTLVARDEQPGKANIEKIPSLKPAFREGGTVTAANSSSISDGAAAVVVSRRSTADQRGLKTRAFIAGHATYAAEPRDFPTAPSHAIAKLLSRIGWSAQSVDLFEINEAFAVVPMATMRDLALAHEKVNIRGGACALGHPIGASGARILVTLLASLEHLSLDRGVASLCLGGGEAVAIAIERAR